MKLYRTLTLTSAMALVTAGPAFADLTAEQVLADQIAQMEIYGLEVATIDQSRSGDVLTVEGLEASMTTPEGTFAMTMGGATFTEQGDGTVVVTYPAEIPLTIKFDSEGEEFEFLMGITQEGMQTVGSGIPEDIRYDYTSDEFKVEVVEFLSPEEATELDMTIEISMSGLTGFMELSGNTVRDYASQFNIEAVSLLLDGDVPEEEGDINVALEVADIAVEYAGKMAAQDFMNSFAQAVQAGNETKGKITHGAMRYGIKGDGPEGAFEGDFTVGSGDLDFSLDKSGLDYGGTNRDMTMTFGGSMIPFPPMTLTMAESSGRFAMPVVPSPEEEQGFAMSLSMVDLVLDPFLWSMFDPGGALPRDPATIVLDLEGQGILTEDIFDPNAAEQMTAAPGQLNAITLNELRMTIAGAELTGDGDFTFNNEGGMPVPSGVVNMMLVGGNGLLDTLVGMGLVPEEQAMGARMMMGLFARPGDGEDTLVSTIEVQEDGSVLANGQRIR
ncbi:MAG: DUF2125 domain-containing protein [Silicimonas sp.]|nr:DUF2125 domain-containing protein [Silicimonas sp.]